MFNVNSQSGEDCVIAAILDTIDEPSGWCVEFGAWDGVHLSNVNNLIINRGFRAVLIEGDPDRANQLAANFSRNSRVHCMCKVVGWDIADNLDSVLATTPIPERFGVLSVDIDGNDFHVWKALSHYRPAVVIIEFNPTIPNSVDFCQPADHRVHQGSSLRALTRLANAKGYELVATTFQNAFYVERQHFPAFNIVDNSIEALHIDESMVTHLFIGYDGSVHLQGRRTAPWHGLPISSRRIQVVPRLLRDFPANYSAIQRQMLRIYRLWRWATTRDRNEILRELKRPDGCSGPENLAKGGSVESGRT